jgi:YVTN family beta-propeller protein
LLAAVGARAQGSTDPVFTAGPAATPAPAFVGDTLTFTAAASSPVGDSLAFSWNFGDGNFTPYGPASGARHAFAEPGRYAVIVRARGASGQVSASYLQVVHVKPMAERARASTTILYDATRKRAWSVNPDNHSVACVEGGLPTLRFEKPVGRNPRTLAQDGEGRLWVVNQGDATLSILDPATGAVLGTVPLRRASQPFGIAASPDGGTLYVTLQATAELVKVDAKSLAVSSPLRLPPQPRHLVVSGDGKRLWVARHISPKDEGEVTAVDAAAFAVVKRIGLAYDPSGDTETSGGGVPNYLGAMALSPDGKRLFIPSKKDNTRKGLFLDARRLDFESTVRTVLSQVRVDEGEEDLPARFDFDNSDLASAVIFSPLGDLAFVTLQGSNRVDILDPYNAMSSLLRLPETGLAPQGLALDEAGKRLFVQNFMSRTVTVYDVAAVLESRKFEALRLATVRTVVQEKLTANVLKGKQVFYNSADARMSLDSYMACASCHLDGGSDRRVWDFTDRGEGLRRTTSLTGRGGMAHGPVHWSANFDEIQDFEHDMRGPMAGAGFLDTAVFLTGTRNKTLGDPKSGLSPDLDALAAYVSSLAEFPASPYRAEDGSFTPDAVKGRDLFNREDVGCARCHSGSRFTDSRLPDPGLPPAPAGPGPRPGDWITAEGFLLHDVGTLQPSSGRRLQDTLRGLDTPTLLGLWEGGPYLHDGSAETLSEVLFERNAKDRHGKTSHLPVEERAQLLAYLMQLGGETTVGVHRGGGIESGNAGLARLGVRNRPGGGLSIAWTLDLPSEGWELSVHDIGGRLVREARSSRNVLRGAHGAWDWDGLDAGGSRAPPGIYLVRLKAGTARLAARAALGGRAFGP